MITTPWAVPDCERPTARLVQSILRRSDGTVTQLLGAWAGEEIGIQTLEQRPIIWPLAVSDRADFSETALGAMNVQPGEPAILRTTLLDGAVTGATYLYARTVIIPGRLDGPLRADLNAGRRPIGRLLIEHRVETIRDILEDDLRPAGEEIGHWLGVAEDHTVMSRTYQIVTRGQPALLITEKLPTVQEATAPARILGVTASPAPSRTLTTP